MEKTINFDLVADLYDSYVQADFDIPFYKEFCKGYSSILELMCGTGRISLPLLMDGYDLTCVDYSLGMLDVFRSKLPKDRHHNILHQDISALDIDAQFELVMIPFNSITEITDKSKRQRAIQRIYEHLAPGGTFFCTLYNPEYRKKTADGSMRIIGKFDMAGSKTLMVTYYNTYDASSEIVSGAQFYEVYGEDNKLIEKRFLDIRFALTSQAEIVTACDAAGFVLEKVYGDYAFSPFSTDSMFMNCVFRKK